MLLPDVKPTDTCTMNAFISGPWSEGLQLDSRQLLCERFLTLYAKLLSSICSWRNIKLLECTCQTPERCFAGAVHTQAGFEAQWRGHRLFSGLLNLELNPTTGLEVFLRTPLKPSAPHLVGRSPRLSNLATLAVACPDSILQLRFCLRSKKHLEESTETQTAVEMPCWCDQMTHWVIKCHNDRRWELTDRKFCSSGASHDHVRLTSDS